MATPRTTKSHAALGLLLLALPLGCSQKISRAAVGDPGVPGPLLLGGRSAFEAAARITLPAVPPQEHPGLHNVFHLSGGIISGAEPHGPGALEQLSAWGVRTILSVDGKAPDAQGALALGMRYVHIPIQYAGITEDERLRIVKTFRELEAPFYVHCYHGRHRGPAAAALGRIVRDGLSREEAIAEMRQWCETAPTYEGLYGAVATAPLPSAAQTAEYTFDFPTLHPVGDVRGVMVELARRWGHFKQARRRGWEPDPGHPDVDLLQEALQAEELLGRLGDMHPVVAGDEEFWAGLKVSRRALADLVQALREGGSPAGAFEAANDSCLACHAAYRNR